MSSNLNYDNTNAAAGAHTHNTHNPLTGDGVHNTHNPLTGDKTGPNPPAGTNPVTGRTKDGELGRNEQHGAGYVGTAGAGLTSGTHNNTHNTSNPLTGDGVHNTHNPLTNDTTGSNHTTGTSPITGRTDGEYGRHDQHGVGHTGVTGAGLTSGTYGTTGTNTHNTHNPLTGNGVNNTHNPLTGDKTGPNPPAGTNPVTGRTNDGELGRHEQHGAGHVGATGTGVHTGTGAHPTSAQTSGGGAKALVGKVEATLGNILKNPEMHAKGVQKQEEAHAAKVAKAEGAHTGSNVPPHSGTGVPSHAHGTAQENLAAEGGPAGAGAGTGQALGGGGRSAI